MKLALIATLAGSLLLAAPAIAQDGAPKKPMTMRDMTAHLAANPPRPISPASESSIPLSSAGSAGTEVWVEMFGHRVVRNVTQPALYPVRPAPGKANGAAVIIAPGGAFLSLAFDNEGLMVANYLAEQGVTSFVLKYRLDTTPADSGQFLKVVGERMRGADPRRTHRDAAESRAIPLAQEDGLAAVRWVRAHAGDYGIDPARIGIMGFSAGGMTAMNVATAYDAASRPDFVGVIYGASPQRAVPKDAPPVFVAVAADDGIMAYASVPIFEAWRAAGRSAELHVYSAGEHGFSMRNVGTSADHWNEHFVQWLKSRKIVP
ncbi:alpha/beta hydrolase [Pseudoduganella umbonata]|uniref:Acetyl esterase/lipase n=1 Tax=Pseudoduganella umbonata TaxID=864828 RepID=A0A4V1EDL8_9BURK|nr:alpha/beta hydrolase [Pseudoduganella umbonata]MBB3225364.1 acetyl esterase/lipase [Pseudoduganella umbonata]QCP11531.1 alpha/beta hydrolase [Pseudoduganella umbonata]